MERVCLTLPLLPTATAQAREFFDVLERDYFAAYEASQARIGVRAEDWFIAKVGGKDLLIAFITYDDFARAVEIFSASRDEFDVWFKERLNACTGIDFENPPELTLPELVSHFPR